MADRKKLTSDLALKNLEGFGITSARFKSAGNIPTEHFALDFAIHYGCNPQGVDLNSLKGYDPSVSLGLPLGKVVEFFGEEGGGKSSLAYRVIGSAQKRGLNVAWIDAEHSFSEDLARINGCDIDNIIFPDNNICAEEVLDLMNSLCVADKVPFIKNEKKEYIDAPKVIVLDSLASLIPRMVDESLSDQQTIGVLPRLLSTNLPKIASSAEKNGVLIIIINQLREKIGITFGDPQTTPGGHAIKHSYSLRLKITKRKGKDSEIYREDENSGENILIGGYSYVNIVKNRFGKPMSASLDIPIFYEPYFPNLADLLFDAGRQLKIISVRQGTFSWNGNKIEGRKKFIDYIKENKLIDSLLKEIEVKAEEEKVLLPPEISKYIMEKKNAADNLEGQVLGTGETEDSNSSEEKPKRGRRKGGTELSEEQ